MYVQSACSISLVKGSHSVTTSGEYATASRVPSALKATAVWSGANGIFGYFATDKWLEGWGGSGR